MKLRIALFLGVFLIFATNLLAEEKFQFPEKLPEHPRLFLTARREAEIKELMKTDAFLDRQVKELLKQADREKTGKVTDYKIPDGKRLLSQSRLSLSRTSLLAFACRMTGDKSYAEAAIAEMLAVCRFKDWNPSHYLDTAEMAAAVGIGYDWLYDTMSDAERKEICDGMLRHAMKTGLNLYEKGGWWVKGHNNWNEVCNAGLTIGALAVADEEREIAEKIVGHAVASLPNGLSAYKPDGAYPEGPMYWAYGASFTGLMLKVLDDVFQDDFGLLQAEGLNITGDYFMGMSGPNYRSFNYADSVDSVDSSPMMFALAYFYDRPDYAVWLRNYIQKRSRYTAGRLAVFNAIWYVPEGKDGASAKTPLAGKYRGIQDVCTMRTAWNDPDAAFVGFKAGNNRANHGHLDIGSFVYEVDGVRWAVDLGMENYNLPGYFGKERWNYFRLNTRSHNTLLIGDKNQNPVANCKLIEFETDRNAEEIATAVADLDKAYEGQVQSARRRATLMKDGSLILEDTLEGVSQPVRWAMMTQAKIKPDGKRAVLEQNGKSIRAEILSGNAEKFEIVSAKPPTDKERQNEEFSILATFAEPQDGKVSIRIVLKPVL